MDLEQQLTNITEALQALGFPPRYSTRQTALCLVALLDTKPRGGLLAGKTCLNDGARIHDIIDFVRTDLGGVVAENTRESYRKQSLKPLLDQGFITITRTSVNDPNTHYRLNREFEDLLLGYLAQESERERERLIARFRRPSVTEQPATEGQVKMEVNGQPLVLSPGAHNELEKWVVEVFAPAFIDEPYVLYIGDAAHKLKYGDPLAKELGICLDEHAKAPDVLLYSRSRNIVYVVEAVTSSGPINEARIRDIEVGLWPSLKTFGVEYFTAFPDRKTLRRFVEEIAWGTQVWIAAEPYGLIIFRRYR